MTERNTNGANTTRANTTEANMADDLKYLIEEEAQLGTRIKVVGVGGGGSNAGGMAVS